MRRLLAPVLIALSLVASGCLGDHELDADPDTPGTQDPWPEIVAQDTALPFPCVIEHNHWVDESTAKAVAEFRTVSEFGCDFVVLCLVALDQWAEPYDPDVCSPAVEITPGRTYVVNADTVLDDDAAIDSWLTIWTDSGIWGKCSYHRTAANTVPHPGQSCPADPTS